ncbi:MAG TPA: hypothetical protein VIL33_07645 [Rhodothermia bacterium]
MKPLILLVSAALMAGCSRPADSQDLLPTKVEGIHFRNVGPGNRQLELINAVVLDPEAGIDARIVQTTAQDKEALAAIFQPSTGETSYIRMPEADGARAISKIGEDVFIGTYLKGQVFRWRPGMESPDRFDLPRPNNERLEFVFSIDRGSDGFYYVGTWPEGALMRLDLTTGVIENLGPLTDDPPAEYYLRHVNSEFEGKLYLSFGTEMAFKQYDLESGQSRDLLPDRFRDRIWVNHSARFRDMVVALIEPPSTLLFFDAESGELVREATVPQGYVWPHNYKTLQVHGDDIYFGTIEEEDLYRYRYETDSFQVVATAAGSPIGLSGEHYLFTRTRLGLYSVIDLTTGEIVLQRQGEFLGDGMLIHTIAEGPDGSVLGSSYINQGFFQYFPETDSMWSPGRSVEFPGQIDNIVYLDGKAYIGHYIKARFSVLDLAGPWAPGNESTSNPRILGSIELEQDRVPHGVAGPDGRIYFGTIADYGRLGGALAVLDPATDSIAVHRNVVQDQSVYALVSDGERYIYGTTSVRGGLGARPSAKESKLFVWDTQSDRKTLERTVVENSFEIWGLDWLEPGKLVGAADSVMFVYDVAADSVLQTRKVAPEAIKKLVASRDGWVYATTEERLIRASADLLQIEEIDVDEGYWDSLVETKDGRLFVGRGADLLEVVR